MKNADFGFDVLFKYATLGILVADTAGNIVMSNPFLLRQFGYTAEELEGQKVEKLIPDRYAGRHESHRDRFSHHPHNRPMGMGMDLFARRKDGTEFPVEISLGVYEAPTGRLVVAFVSDISLRKQSEDALRELNAELEQKVADRTESLSKLVKQMEMQMKEIERKDNELRMALQKEKDLNELKSRFVSMASHEFRTPLSTVLSSSYLISRYTAAEEQPQREKHIQRIVSSVNLLTDILNDFLSVGKIEEGRIHVRPATVNVESIIGATVQELFELNKKDQRISYVHTGDPEALLDPALLKHIILNLLSNAIKFSPEGSAIRVSSEREGQQLVIRVADQGRGISEDDQAHLFERFFRGNNVSDIQGTGLGLHIVAKYTELMDGNIQCRSQVGNGTEFILTFQIPPNP
ncbi:PAS domain-containing sensor histidine kinase [Chitinophaga sp. NPDC101104]|uniref:PAS domain-containing sensor histidine kinase n=1 Tax=Chitinophaga sp. NPDC101104 TaxID=3390561 RepID=UPI003D07BF6E